MKIKINNKNFFFFWSNVSLKSILRLTVRLKKEMVRIYLPNEWINLKSSSVLFNFRLNSNRLMIDWCLGRGFGTNSNLSDSKTKQKRLIFLLNSQIVIKFLLTENWEYNFIFLNFFVEFKGKQISDLNLS